MKNFLFFSLFLFLPSLVCAFDSDDREAENVIRDQQYEVQRSLRELQRSEQDFGRPSYDSVDSYYDRIRSRQRLDDAEYQYQHEQEKRYRLERQQDR